MPIGFNGQSYDSEFEMLYKNHVASPVQRADTSGTTHITVTPETKPTTDSTDASMASTMPLGSSEKPAGEFNSESGTTLPPQENSSPEPSGRPTPDYMNPPEGSIIPKIAGGLEHVAKSVWDAMLAPGNALQGKMPVWAMDPETGEMRTSRDVIEKTNDLAGLMVMGPAPVASKLAEGTLGSFAGVRSATLDKTKLYKAQNMELQGAHPDDIWKETGFFKGADDRWRYEIPNDMSNIKLSGTELTKTGKIRIKKGTEGPNGEDWTSFVDPDSGISLSEVLHNPELFKSYPFLKDMEVRHFDFTDGTRGMYHPGEKAIYMNPDKPDKFLSTLQHEVQHAIQQHEGFAFGGNSRMFSSPELLNASAFFENAAIDKLKEFAKLNPKFDNSMLQAAIENKMKGYYYYFDDDVKANIDNLVSQAVKLGFNPKISEAAEKVGEAKVIAHQKYLRLMGEVESRNVQARLDFDNTERFLKSPRSTEDVPRFLQRDPGQASTFE